MSLRIITIVTRLRAEDAHTLIEFLDQVRDALMQTYSGEIRAMLREAETTRAPGKPEDGPGPRFSSRI